MIVVHPKDPSTAMLRSIYEELPDVKLFDSYLQREEILSAIAAAPKDEPILLLGHGCPSGLLDMRHGLVIDDGDADLLKDRPNLVCIWCYASTYGYNHDLAGFFSGMFISEPVEALMCGISATDYEIEWGASDFALRLGNLLRAGKAVREAAQEMMDPKWIVSELTRYNYSRLEYIECTEGASVEEAIRNAPLLTEEEEADFWDPDELCHEALEDFMWDLQRIDREKGWDEQGRRYCGELSLESIGKDFRKVDFEEYRESCTDERLDDFVNGTGEDFTVEDVRALMYGFTFTDFYSGHSETSFFDNDWWAGRLMEADNEFSPQEELIARAILSTGDGRTPETAFAVIDAYQEYQLISMLMPEHTPLLKRQSLLEGGIDCLEFEDNPYGVERMYFDVHRRFEVGYFNDQNDPDPDLSEE